MTKDTKVLILSFTLSLMTTQNRLLNLPAPSQSTSLPYSGHWNWEGERSHSPFPFSSLLIMWAGDLSQLSSLGHKGPHRIQTVTRRAGKLLSPVFMTGSWVRCSALSGNKGWDERSAGSEKKEGALQLGQADFLISWPQREYREVIELVIV